MKKGMIAIIAVVAILLIFVVGAVGTYNDLVKKEEDVTSALADIDVQLERRADLIPNLVNTVKGYMSHEQSIIDNITSARENLMKAGSIEEKASANDQLTTALNNLLVVVENYPDLKANQNFINLQDELAGTENRLATARRDYNNIAKEFNKEVRLFPKNMIAKMFGFEQKDYFEASESSKIVPNVSFD